MSYTMEIPLLCVLAWAKLIHIYLISDQIYSYLLLFSAEFVNTVSTDDTEVSVIV